MCFINNLNTFFLLEYIENMKFNISLNTREYDIMIFLSLKMCSFLIEKSYYEKFRRYKEAQRRTLTCQPHYPEIIYMHVLIYVFNVLYAILYIIIHIYLCFLQI